MSDTTTELYELTAPQGLNATGAVEHRPWLNDPEADTTLTIQTVDTPSGRQTVTIFLNAADRQAIIQLLQETQP